MRLIAEPVPDVEDLVPHRGRMKLVRALVAADQGGAETEARVEESWPTFSGGSVDAVVLVELIAQSVGVHMGWERRHVERMGGRGLLVGVRRASFSVARVESGSVLRTRVRRIRSVEAFVVFSGAVSDGRGTLCEAELQAFRPDDMEAGG
ncbi:MAG: hypothetical protein HY907_14015 [Deltaproteobacteria bacterium]|nr:hypothetical protein [Deltaproteobacteria bacterium]